MKTTSLFFIIILLLFTTCKKEIPSKQPQTLHCEYQENPLGVDVTAPRLSWLVNDISRGGIQTAYQLLVASDIKLLKKDIGDVWNSEKTENENIQKRIYQNR